MHDNALVIIATLYRVAMWRSCCPSAASVIQGLQILAGFMFSILSWRHHSAHCSAAEHLTGSNLAHLWSLVELVH